VHGKAGMDCHLMGISCMTEIDYYLGSYANMHSFNWRNISRSHHPVNSS